MSLIYSLYLYITQRAIDLQTEYTRIDNSMSSNQISIFRVKNEQEGIMLAKKKLYESCDKKSALFIARFIKFFLCQHYSFLFIFYSKYGNLIAAHAVIYSSIFCL